MKYKHIIFDLDGTLVNSIYGISAAMNSVLGDRQINPLPVNFYQNNVGFGRAELVRRVIRKTGKELDQTQLVNAMKKEYGKLWDHGMEAYSGIPELLKEMDKRKLGTSVNTNKDEQTTLKILSRFFPGHTFCCIVAEDTLSRPKPDSMGVDYICSKLNLNKKECLYIGDSEVDIQTASNAGVDCLAVGWGFRKRKSLKAAGAEIIVDSAQEIMKEILQNNQTSIKINESFSEM